MATLTTIALLSVSCAPRGAPAGDSCETRAAELASWAEHVAGQYADVDIPSGIRLAPMDGAPVPGGRRVLIVGLAADGVTLDDAPRLPVDEADLHGRASAGIAVMLAIDEGASWRDVVAMVDRIRVDGVAEIDLMFSARHALPKPASSIDPEIASRDNELALEMFAAKEVYGRCPDAGNAVREGAWSKAKVALVACDCAVDLDAARAAAFARMTQFGKRPALSTVRIVLGDDGQVIAHAPTSEWRDVAAAVVEVAGRGRRSRFAVTAAGQGK